MTTTSPMELSDAGFLPLAPLLQTVAPQRLDSARSQVADFDRKRLINSFRAAFANRKRLAAFVLADELTTLGIPPVFRHSHLSATDYSIDQRFDLLVSDLRWLRRWYPDHVRIVRYQRCKNLLIGNDTLFHREVEYMFYGGRRPTWKIVASLSLSEKQQFDCHWLRSAPIKKRDALTQAMRARVFQVLREDLKSVRRTQSFTDDHAEAALIRRHALWICSRMTDGSPTETAVRYTQMTGQQITRQTAAKQLEKIRNVLHKSDMTLKREKEMRKGVRIPFSET